LHLIAITARADAETLEPIYIIEPAATGRQARESVEADATIRCLGPAHD
jgi:hypothetical protein